MCHISIIAFCVFQSNTWIIANCEISPTNGVSIFTYFCSFGFKHICSFGKKGIDLFKRLKHDTHKFIMPSKSNIFFMLSTRSMFSCIYDTNVKNSNLWPCITITIGTMNKYTNELSISYLNTVHFKQILVMNVRICIINMVWT